MTKLPTMGWREVCFVLVDGIATVLAGAMIPFMSVSLVNAPAGR